MDGDNRDGGAFLDDLVSATCASQLLEQMSHRFGDDAEVFAVDHAFSSLVAVGRNTSDRAPVEFEADMRATILAGNVYDDGTHRWTPLPERAQTVFVVRSATSPTRTNELARVLGSILCDQRSRFEDLELPRRREDMSTAAELQWDLLPKRGERLGDYLVGSTLEPAYDVAGDVFDYAMNGDDLWIYSFDGMGHGLAATMMSVLTLSAVRNVRRGGGGLVEQMEHASSTLLDHYGGDCFVTGVACMVGPDGHVAVVNAGHEPIRLVNVDAEGAVQVERLELMADVPLGITADPGYRSQTGPQLRPGHGMVLFSDGPANATSPGGGGLGADDLDGELAASWSNNPLQTAHDVMERVLGFIDGGDVSDDMTAVVVRRLQPGAMS